MELLSVKNLNVRFSLPNGELSALHDINFSLKRGERLALVGESGAGKSVLGFSLINLLSSPGYISGGQILFNDVDMVTLPAKDIQKIRGNRIAMIFQDPMSTLNPLLTVGQQMTECLHAHIKISRNSARKIAIKKLRQAQISSPEQCLKQYPHELSGGMCQRVIIAIALLLDPDLIIADEPTTALDVTIQAQIIELLVGLCSENDVALLLITHDIGLVLEVTNRTMVLYAGEIIEIGPTREIVNDPQHPYTQGLLNALPQMALPGQRLNQIRGNMPSLVNRSTKGCAFRTRCNYAFDACTHTKPPFFSSGGCQVACHLMDTSADNEDEQEELL